MLETMKPKFNRERMVKYICIILKHTIDNTGLGERVIEISDMNDG